MIPARSVLPAAVRRQSHQRLSVGGLHQRVSELNELLGRDEASHERGRFGAAQQATSASFELARVDRCIEQRIWRAGVEPTRSLAECLHA